MVSQATVQSKVLTGFSKAASVLGVPCQWYRPSDATAPIVPANLLGTAQVLFDTSPELNQGIPRKRDKPEEWYAATGTAGVTIGDYLVTPLAETYFITTIDPFRPYRAVLCNRMVTITNPASMPLQGLNLGYGGDLAATETPVITGWPASLIKGPRGDSGDLKLPGDVKLPWEDMLLPVLPGVLLRNDMIVTYNDGAKSYRLIMSLVELTSLGYRATAILETA